MRSAAPKNNVLFFREDEGGATAELAELSAETFLPNSNLPLTLKARLLRDMLDSSHYERLQHISELRLQPPNSSWTGSTFACLSGRVSCLVDEGCVGLLHDNERYAFLAPGYHAYTFAGVSFEGTAKINQINSPVLNGPAGFITITDGNIGVVLVGAEYRLLPPGIYQWAHAAVQYVSTVAIGSDVARLGPFTLVTVPEGVVAATYNNGQLRMLGYGSAEGQSRTFFLDDPKWTLGALLPTSMQTDRLEGNDLLSKDNVEILMVAMAQWRISDPVAAVTHCASEMSQIRAKVNQLVRAAIARIVASTNIGAGPVSGSMARPLVTARAVADSDTPATGVPVAAGSSSSSKAGDAETDLSHLMQSAVAVKHMAELSANMSRMGIEVVGVFVPEKRMKNDDIREQVARQAVIGIKADAERAAADAQAYATVAAARAAAEAQRQAAEATAYARVTTAKAEAEAIALVSEAHAKAGERLGAPESTAARIALTDKTSAALANAKVTIFSGAPSRMPFMLNGAD